MVTDPRKAPTGDLATQEAVIASSAELGRLVRQQRKYLDLRQTDIAGLGNTGNRFIVDLEKGKPTVQLQMALDIMGLLGLELVVRSKSRRAL